MTPQAQSAIAASGEVFPMEPVFQARRDVAPTVSARRAYPPLPEVEGAIAYPASEYEDAWVSSAEAYDAGQMYAFVDADRAAAAYEIAKLKAELEKAYEGFARERGRAKIVAPTLREFIDAWIALMPAAEQGIEAQNAWADRRTKAMKDAVALLREIEQ